ncbi:MAG: phosphate acyltransferase PlsX [Campylobacter lanienae]|nr:phosphate acyltransferase PlsX [Campylobacter sp.]MDD7323920.1 phosphate acyltransferase PlsX [Campylobacteraceae bacterium]MDY2817626.1 phosphate acyltransferase PlsX [Campylobacter lanienae]MDD7741732.1 phosphate acyltransferase PlsX [Campylobacteraceae bacterium]MDY3671923.1 phosphate acyltransferase PlsX [Campylobacter sp.]
MIKIAIDAMGGDFGPAPIVEGVLQALNEASFEAILVGKRAEIEPLVPKGLESRISYEEASDVFDMDEMATDALKRKDSSIYKAIELVRNGSADAVVSAGHSGATMSLATLRIGRLDGVSRPPIATLMPTIIRGKKTLVLDVGANVDCKPEHLFEFAVMSEAYAQQILHTQKPKISLLSNGEEDCKGNETSKAAFELLKKMDNFVGNAEGNQVFDGSVDIIVCDGFVGNILLKTAEGVSGAISKIIKRNVKESAIAMIGAVLLNRVFKKLKNDVDYDEYGGAPLLGVKKCTIISHGKSSPKAIKNAIFQSIKFSKSNINEQIISKLESYNQ